MHEPARDFEPASRHLDVEIVTRPGTRLAKIVRAILIAVMGLITGDHGSGPSANDLVVTRRATGREVLRVSAGSIVEADQLHQRVRADLETKSVETFVSEWRLPTGG